MSDVEKLLHELCEMQEKKVLQCGQIFVPHLTAEDILQPMDFPELEYNPHFRYEEGVLEGIRTVYTALKSLSFKGMREFPHPSTDEIAPQDSSQFSSQ